MTCRPDKAFLAVLLVLLALPALAGGRDDPLADAATAIDRGDGVAAEVAARRALDAGEPHAAVDAYLGEAALLRGDFDEARKRLAAGGFDPASAQRGYHALGKLELAAGHFAPAAVAFDRALQAGKPDARLWVDIGRLRYQAGEQHLAADAVNRALAIDPGEPRALKFQAELVRDAQGLAAAQPWFERAAQRAPKDLEVLGEYAATLGDLGRYREMLAVARTMVKIDRTDPRAYFLQAVLAARAGQDELARRLLWSAKGAYDESPAGMVVAGLLEYRAGSTELAVERFDKLADLQPDNETAARLLASALLADGDASEVIARFAGRAARSDASPYLLTLVGRAYEQIDRRDLAAPFLDRAARAPDAQVGPLAPSEAGDLAIYRWGADPTAADVAVPTLRKLLSQGRTVEAAEYSLKLRQRYPNSSDIEVLTGDAALLGGDFAGALALYRSAKRVRWTASLAQRIAAAERALGQDGLAEAELAGYLAQHPQDRAMAALVGRAAARDGDWRRAAMLLGHAARLPGGAGDPRLIADLADAQLHLGDRRRALANARRAYALERASPRATSVLAAALEANGTETSGADVLLAKARALGGEPALAVR
uniref:tetratricopeptide repeat protein n=1 Tax=Altererythrobacter segetis TaxID=1104773 RepID=UPI00140C0546|nr:tetratricopeptide repeat protein [Altererythrobacter segetis]